MEVKYHGTLSFLLFFLVISLPYMSRGGLEAADSEIYEIDYRGPETHTSVIPPPNHYRNHRPSAHYGGATAFHRAKGSSGDENGENAVKIHG